jgi:7-cyano-7-deazaguanine synthase
MMYRKAYVLLSGGLDSTVCLAIAMQQAETVEAVSVNYGQRHKKEMEYAKSTCDRLGIAHTILDVGALLRGDMVMLTDDSRGKVDVPNISYGEIKGVSPTYVPFRNGLMLSALTAHAQKWVNQEIETLADHFLTQCYNDIHDKQDAKKAATEEMRDQVGLYFGAHADDAAGNAYPDCRASFTGAMANAIGVGSYDTIVLNVPLQWMNKQEIVEKGTKLGVDFANTWSCYRGDEFHCGTCPTCRSRREAFAAAGIDDPTIYHKSAQAAE